MKLSRKWLNEFVDVSNVSDKEYADAMTMSGSIVEGYTIPGAEITNVVVGQIMEVAPHPNADRLSICTVNVGKPEMVTIVTGAKNVKSGDIVPVALDGATLPEGVEIKNTNMRGVNSQGMLCSIDELSLTSHDIPGADNSGILILNDDSNDISLEGVELGDDIRPVLGLDDTVAEFEITPNRPDCLSIIGLARETAAVFDRPINIHEPNVNGSGGNVSDYLEVEIQSDLCPRYAARVVTDVKIAPSPAWLRNRLRSSGVRPINNIVDITNYVMLEYGQPMHAFDYACLEGKKIVVRTAREGETIDTLDEKKRDIREGTLLICDEQKPVAIAGVMGGANSEITEKTQVIVFESANFNGPSVRRTATSLGMRTESSARFEKGLDPENVIPALQRACELIELLGAGKVVDGLIDNYPSPVQKRSIILEPEKINSLLGTDLTEEYMKQVLSRLSFEIDGNSVLIPSWRADVEKWPDLAEEVARLYGYENIPMSLMRGATTIGVLTEEQKTEKVIEDTCYALGYSDIITYSFISPSYYDKIRMPKDSPLRKSLEILNPLGEDTGIMRTVSLPSMMETLTRNLNNRNEQVRLFELAKVYILTEDKLPEEKKVLTLGAYGGDFDFFELKGDIEGILESLRIDYRFIKTSDQSSYHPGQCAEIFSGDTRIGVFGQVHPIVVENYGMDVRVYAAELDFNGMFKSIGPDVEFTPLPKFPAMVRDMAVVCDLTIPAGALLETAKEVSGDLLESVEIFDVYTGDQVPKGKKSVALSLKFRHSDRTLTDEEADTLFNRCLSALGEKFGAVLR
jgi:phenylalanyl-tRNA synthetase beta chain